ncbi:MAG: HAMP domain-containing sensor histidine kinase [Rhodospirillales bacterium]
MYPRFQFRFAMVLIALILISGMAITFIQLRSQGFFLEEMNRSSAMAMEKALLEQSRKKARNMAHLITSIIANPLYYGRLDVLGSFATAMSRRSDVDYFYILGTDLKVLHDGTKHIDAYGKDMKDPLTEAALTQRSVKFQSEEAMLHVAAPVSIGMEIIGVIKFCVSISDFQKDIARLHGVFGEVEQRTKKDILYISFALAGILSLLGVVFSIFIARWLSRPVEEFFKQRNDELENSNASLHEEVVERRKIELALRQSERRSRDFAADAAHELRTPLAVLRAQLDSLEDKKVAETLREDVDDMARMVEQLLAATRLDFLTVNANDRADLSKICRRVVEHIGPYALGQNRTIEVIGADAPIWARGNASALEQAVRNLVENAIKHSKAGTTVTIQLDDEPAIKVIDRGEGVPYELRNFIFRRFWRADSRGGGAGLGLSIVQKTVEIHNGSVDIEDNPQGGAIFTIHLPRAA